MPLDSAGVHARLRERFGDAIGELAGTGRNAACTVEPARIAEVCRFLKSEPALRFDCLSNLSGVDYPARSVIQVVYHLFSYPLRHWIVLKVDAVRDDPVVPTVSDVWSAAGDGSHGILLVPACVDIAVDAVVAVRRQEVKRTTRIHAVPTAVAVHDGLRLRRHQCQ